VNERVTDLIFRMEALDEDFISSTWVETEARHDQASSSSDLIRQQESIDNQGSEKRRIEPIRNRGEVRVGRNAPCPCQSGKKYKNCCMRRAAG
jgi:preprotein translocase subunit SecA